jgi:hypothetical protein
LKTHASTQEEKQRYRSVPFTSLCLTNLHHLVVEYAPKVVPVWEHVSLAGQVGAPAVNQVQAGQPARLSNFLQPQVLLQAAAAAANMLLFTNMPLRTV